jgi:hypothetical protein
MRHHLGLNVSRVEDEEEFNFPKTATAELLEDEQYLYGVFRYLRCAPLCPDTLFKVLLCRSLHGLHHRQ